jgi:hypothetical protein
MRLRPAAAAFVSTLVLTSSALAHIDTTGTVAATGRSTLNLTAHNDREEPMSAVRATTRPCASGSLSGSQTSPTTHGSG